MLWRILAVLLLIPFHVAAQSLPSPRTDTVSDFAQILGAAAKTGIARDLQAIRDETGVHVVVVTMGDRIGGQSGERMETYAKRLFNAWGVGDAARNDGIMILVLPDERAVRIALGTGYSSVYDGRAQRVIDTAMLPEFRNGNYGDGIVAGIASVRTRIITPFLSGQPVTEDAPGGGAGKVVGWIAALGLLGTGVAMAGRAIWRGMKRCPRCNQPTLERQNQVIQFASRLNSGHGITHRNCPSCGFTDQVAYTIARQDDDDHHSSGRSGGGGSSSGGFGGGGSSGGGGSGRW